ncbi:MAG: FMN-binding protein [Armatimonadetes bacterium]|nr:FMN-binding protein [Armatimonadota bacterium]
MIRKKIIMLVLVAFAFSFISTKCFAKVLLKKDQALKEMFPKVDEIVTETKIVTPEDLIQLKDRMEGRLFLYKKNSKSKKLPEQNEYTFYFGVKNNERIGVAVIEIQPGKWGPVKFIVALDMEGKVKNLAVMSFVEKRGRPIARRSFLKQFLGKGSKDPIKIHKDIRAITGATISSRSVTFTVRKVIALFEELFLPIDLTINKD